MDMRKVASDNLTTFMSVSLRISGTVYHMIVIFGTLVQKDDISSNVFQFLKILFFGGF